MLRKKIEGTAVEAQALQMDALTENLMWPSSPSPFQQGLLLETKVTVVKTETMKKEGYFRKVLNISECHVEMRAMMSPGEKGARRLMKRN